MIMPAGAADGCHAVSPFAGRTRPLMSPREQSSGGICRGGTFRFLILGLLRDGAPRHGYAVAKAYKLRSGGKISTGNFYRELQRLVADGLACTASNPPGADPRRTPYAITTVGRATFDAW